MATLSISIFDKPGKIWERLSENVLGNISRNDFFFFQSVYLFSCEQKFKPQKKSDKGEEKRKFFKARKKSFYTATLKKKRKKIALLHSGIIHHLCLSLAQKEVYASIMKSDSEGEWMNETELLKSLLTHKIYKSEADSSAKTTS